MQYPVTFTFRGKTFDMPSGQFDLVHRSDLHVPLVILKAASPKMQGAKFVVNSYKCNFHQRTNSSLVGGLEVLSQFGNSRGTDTFGNG